jgi:hypothetical protein
VTEINKYRRIVELASQRERIAEALKASTIPDKIKIYGNAIVSITEEISVLFHTLPEPARINPEEYFKKQGVIL